MRRTLRPRSRPVAPNLTPMIDVVFLLIIFFLVSSYLAQREPRLDLELPVAATGQRTSVPGDRWTIDIPAGGAPQLFGEPIDAPALLARLQEHQAKDAGAPAIRFRGDGATDFAVIEPLLVACAEGGATDLSFGVFPASRDR